jgi:sporulation protein YlmC with PRC-barrel domain
MLCTVKTIKGSKLDGIDGEIGEVKEFYFDDRHWTIRYLVADTGTWLPGRKVLISPYALGAINKDIYNRQIAINLTKKQIEDSPSLDSDKPISRQFEHAFHKHYDWPTYWSGPYSWGSDHHIERDREKWKASLKSKKAMPRDHHLRSTHAVTGYHIQASDGEIGHVEDFVIDDETWAIRYLMVNTQNFWPGKNVLISPQWIDRVSWHESKVFVNLSRETIKESPEYTEEFLLTRDYETELHRYYHRKGYWEDELLEVAECGR